jgi:chemotaxis protein CheD
MQVDAPPLVRQMVPMGQLVVCPVPAILIVHGLGSCVAVFLYDERHRVGGLAHALLPSGSRGERERTPGKYVSSAIEAMLRKFEDLGVAASELVAKVAGGAAMFVSAAREQRQGIGERNVRATLRALEERGIPVLGSDVGGCCGRTVQARTADGILEVSSLRQPPRLL